MPLRVRGASLPLQRDVRATYESAAFEPLSKTVGPDRSDWPGIACPPVCFVAGVRFAVEANPASVVTSYLFGSYRIATAPEANSRRPTSFKSRCFDSPANNVGPWPASLGCTTNSYSSINPS